MPDAEIIDNRERRLVEVFQELLPRSARAKFAVGYFFVSGLDALRESLDQLQELRLLIGNTSNRETIEQIAEGYRRLELAQERADELRLARAADHRRRVGETAENLREAVAVMDQTDEGEELIRSLVRMVEEGRLKVRVYTRGRLHAKAYIFDYSQPNPGANGIAIVGSSNLTLSGIQDNTELNVLVHDNANTNDPASGNHGKLTAWFNELWDEAQDFDQHLMDELRQSWAGQLATPYDVYMKTLYTLVQDRLEGGDRADLLGEDDITRDLADFQRVALDQAVRMIREYGGCFVADVVGLGKSYIGAAIVKHFERADRARALIVCPKPLEEMWVHYNAQYQLNAEIVPMSMLQEGERGVDLLNDIRYRDRDFVLIDESHNFRHSDTQRYRVLADFIAAAPERKACLLTATPRNSRAMDVYNQIKLFHPDDTTILPIDPPHLRDYFKAVAAGEASAAQADGQVAKLQDVLRHIMIRRTRRHVLRWFGYAEDTGRPLSELSESEAARYLDGTSGQRAYILVGGRPHFFPRRELEALRYSIEDTYNGLYEMLRGYLGRPGAVQPGAAPPNELTYARYGLYNYLRPEARDREAYSDLQRAGRNLRGLMRTMLFKRFESSVEAFRNTLERMIDTQTTFLTALAEGIVPAGESAERLLGQSDRLDEDDLLDALEAVSGQYRADDFDISRLRRDVDADVRLMRDMLALVRPITPEKDDKLIALQARLNAAPVAGAKCLIFTQYADTADYLYRHLNPGGRHDDIAVISGGDASKARVAARFAPRANPEVRLRPGEREIRVLIATDVLAEGLNLQDCNVVINYDLHWNPVRLIQRFGRIDRIGSEHDTIRAFNFLPEIGIEKHLHLTEVLKNRIREIHQTIGEDAAILDRTEQLNPEAMYSIYTAGDQLGLFDDEEQEPDYVDLNEAEEALRRLRQDNPDEYERIANLRDGIRSGMSGQTKGRYVFCRAGRYQELVLLDEHGNIVTRDIGKVLAAIRATPETPTLPSLPPDHNAAVMRVKRRFDVDVKHWRSQREHRRSETVGQRYVLNELRILMNQAEDEERREELSILERAFRLTPTAAVKRELARLRRDGVQGRDLYNALVGIYNQHQLKDRLAHDQRAPAPADIPQVVCSLVLA